MDWINGNLCNILCNIKNLNYKYFYKSIDR